MKVGKEQAIRENWDNVRSWNYKLQGIKERYQSVVYAELNGVHGEVITQNAERIYYILSGKGEFKINEEIIPVEDKDVISVPANTRYDYWSTTQETLKILLFMELWDN